MTVFAKAPASRVDFSLDWTDWLADGETITSASWRTDPDEGESLVLDDPVGAGAVRGIHASGGNCGSIYRLVCSVTTSQDRVVERGISIKIMER